MRTTAEKRLQDDRLTPAPSWGSDRVVEQEDLGSGIGPDVVRAHETHDVPLGQPLDRPYELGAHGLLECTTDLQDLSRSAGVHEALLPLGHVVLEQDDDEIRVESGARLRRSPSRVL